MTKRTGRTVSNVNRSTANRRQQPQSAPTPAPQAQVITLPDGEPLDLDEENELALESILTELGALGKGKVTVHRIPRDGAAAEFVATYLVDELQGETGLLERIQQEYGGGKFRCYVHDGVGMRANRVVSIAERRKPAQQDQGVTAVQTMQAFMDRLDARFAQMLQPRQDTEEAVLGRIKVMAEILRPQAQEQSAGAALRDVMDALHKGIELGKSMNPDAGGSNTEGVLAAALNTFAPVIAKAAQAAPPVRPVPPIRVPAAAGVASSSPGPIAPAAPPVQQQQAPVYVDDEGEVTMRQLLNLVVLGASRNAEPSLYAELVIDQAGEEQVRQLIGQATAPAMVEMLASIDPRVQRHAKWFLELHGAIVELLSGDSDADPVAADGAAAGPGGSPADTAPHA